MLRALHRQIANLLRRVKRTGSGSSTSRAIQEAEEHRREVERRSGGGWGP